MQVASVILTKDEEARIEGCLLALRPCTDYILVLDGVSEDGTVKIAEKHADKVVTRPFSGSFAEEKNYARTLVPKSCSWILWVDADERFDPGFLKNIKAHTEAQKGHGICFRFARINLPNSRNYPDYQVRLFMNSRDIQWKGDLHEIPYYIPENVPLDSLDDLKREFKLFVITVNEYPIIHLPRRKDLDRIWWKEK